MGNPPFGHSGEKAIQTFFTENEGKELQSELSPAFWSDITHFEGNANAFRLLTHQFIGRRAGGFDMTYSMLASMVKYPYESSLAGEHGKFGFFTFEKETYQKVAEELGISCLSSPGKPLRYARHPLVYLVEAADDICYEIMDIEDSHKLKILSYEETRDLLLNFFKEERRESILRRIQDEGITDENEQVVYMRACVIGVLEKACVDIFVKHEEELLAGTFQGSLIGHIPEQQKAAYQHCQKISYEKIYNSKPVLDIELSGYKIMETLMRIFIGAAVHPDKFYSRQLIRRVSSQYDINSPEKEKRIMAVLDFISGMTDVYALDLYQKVNGISLPIV
jgi:dGTPase